MIAAIRSWLAGVLLPITVGLLVLWWPPMAMLLAERAGFVQDSGVSRLFEPGTLAALVELILLTAGAWELRSHARSGWVALAWSRAAALVRLAWGMLALSRLNGIAATLQERIIWDSVAMLVVSTALLAFVRPEFASTRRTQPRAASLARKFVGIVGKERVDAKVIEQVRHLR